jgi:hypothetical protein
MFKFINKNFITPSILTFDTEQKCLLYYYQVILITKDKYINNLYAYQTENDHKIVKFIIYKNDNFYSIVNDNGHKIITKLMNNYDYSDCYLNSHDGLIINEHEINKQDEQKFNKQVEQEINKQEINNQEINKQEINKQEINEQEINKLKTNKILEEINNSKLYDDVKTYEKVLKQVEQDELDEIKNKEDEKIKKQNEIKTLNNEIKLLNKKEKETIEELNKIYFGYLKKIHTDYNNYLKLNNEEDNKNTQKIYPILDELLKDEKNKLILNEINIINLDNFFINGDELPEQTLSLCKYYTLESKKRHKTFKHKWDTINDDIQIRNY